eukprot:15327636-Ditylum_brightwellii.AAC.1
MMMLHPAAKQLWLQAVDIAVHDYKVINKRRPTQSQITQFFPQQNMENDPQHIDLLDESAHAADWADGDNWELNQLILKKQKQKKQLAQTN